MTPAHARRKTFRAYWIASQSASTGDVSFIKATRFHLSANALMGVIYSVFPLDDEIADYLRDMGIAVPGVDRPARNPTPREVREVCASLTDCRAEILTPPKYDGWQVNLEGRAAPEREPWTVLQVSDFNGSEEAPHSIWFEKGWPELILRVVHGLARTCGPLVIIPDTGEDPAVVTSSDLVDEILRAWEHTEDVEDE